MTNVGIYKITSPSGKVYIGQSWNIKRRFERYRGMEAKKQPKLYNSFLKYGVKAHEFKIIAELPNDEKQEVMNSYEDFYLCQYRSCGFEVLNTKEAGSRGKHSAETKLKISILNKGRGAGVKRPPYTEEHKRNISLAQKGRKLSLERNEKNRLGHIGLKASEETKKKMSIAQQGRKHTKESIEKIKQTKKERGITMAKEVIEKGIPTRFKKGCVPANKWMSGRIPWNKGKTGIYSEGTIAKIKAARALQIMQKGRLVSEETRKRMSESAKKRGQTPKTTSLKHYENGS